MRYPSAAVAPVQADLIRLHFFAGRSADAADGVLGILLTTAQRPLNHARAWIYRRITRGP